MRREYEVPKRRIRNTEREQERQGSMKRTTEWGKGNKREHKECKREKSQEKARRDMRSEYEKSIKEQERM